MTHAHAPAVVHAVAVDIGPGRGALVIRVDAALRGQEIEISRAGDGEARQHVWALERGRSGSGVVAAVFGSLAAGEYRVWLATADGAPCRSVSVESAGVVEVDARS